jgi:hypothetical protein
MKSFVDNDLLKTLRRIVLRSKDQRAIALKSMGFHQLRLAHHREVWRNDELKLIVKKGFFLDQEAPIGLGIPTEDLADGGWVCQPLADLSDRSGALEEVKARLSRVNVGYIVDVHIFNVGHHDGSAILFDW